MGRNRAYDMAKDGTFPVQALQIGRNWMCRVADVERYVYGEQPAAASEPSLVEEPAPAEVLVSVADDAEMLVLRIRHTIASCRLQLAEAERDLATLEASIG